MLIVAYVVSPAAAMTLFSVITIFLRSLTPGSSQTLRLDDTVSYIIFGTVLGIFVEIAFVTPLLLILLRYFPSAITGRYICATGFVLGAALYGIPALMESAVTFFMWGPLVVLANTLLYGLVGLVDALVFRLVAFQAAVTASS